jgi:hypothetical protein
MVILDTDELRGLLENAVISVRKRAPIRRRREKKLKAAIPENPGAAQKIAAPAVKTDRTDSPAGGIAPKLKGNEAFKNEASKMEWIRKQTSTIIDTGLGKIVKHSDGSFDYD